MAKGVNVPLPNILQLSSSILYMLLASAIVALVGLALWKTTVGKILIVGGIAGLLGFLAAGGAFYHASH